MEKKPHILDIAPFMAQDCFEFPEFVFDISRYEQFLKSKKQILGRFYSYLICRLHDSRVLEVQIESGRLRIVLNDFTTKVFADAVIKKLKISGIPADTVFPVIIEFNTVESLNLYTMEESGDLNQIQGSRLDEYLSEQVMACDRDGIDIVMQFWKSNTPDPGEKILLWVKAKSLNIEENQEKEWKRLFGDRFEARYAYFRQQFIAGKYISDFQACLDLIDEFDAGSN